MPKAGRGGKRGGSGSTAPQAMPQGRGIAMYGGYSNLAELAAAVQQNNQQINQILNPQEYEKDHTYPGRLHLRSCVL